MELYCVFHYTRVKSSVTQSIMRNYMAISIIKAEDYSDYNKSAYYSAIDQGLMDKEEN